MKVLIDTNVILDVLCKREEFLEDSLKVWKYCEVDQITGYVSALSVPNIVYILRKELDPEKTKEIIDKLFLIFRIADLKSDDLKKAANMKKAPLHHARDFFCSDRRCFFSQAFI